MSVLSIWARGNGVGITQNSEGVDKLLEKVFYFPFSIDSIISGDSLCLNVYVNYHDNAVKRNMIVYLTPYIQRYGIKEREYAGEIYGKAKGISRNGLNLESQLEYCTKKHAYIGLDDIENYVNVNIYDDYIIKEMFLSPFCKANRNYYKYSMVYGDSVSILSFKPKLDNTMLVSGKAEVDTQTGQVLNTEFEAGFGMLHFNYNITLGKEGIRTLFPVRCNSTAVFKIFGTKVKRDIVALYDFPTNIPDSTDNDRDLFDRYRPEPLNDDMQRLYNKSKNIVSVSDSASKKNNLKEFGNSLISSHKIRNKQASLSFSPFINPLAFDYKRSKGLSYNFKTDFTYNISNNNSFKLYPNIGYTFKDEYVYYRLPFAYIFNREKMGLIGFEYANGNRITNSAVVDKIKSYGIDSLDLDGMDYFKDYYCKLHGQYGLNKKIVFNIGATYHRRKATEIQKFKDTGQPYQFHSFAPYGEISYIPYKDKLKFMVNYEHAISGIFSNSLKYSKLETDATYNIKLKLQRSIILRAGFGSFLYKAGTYFLDYDNFRDNNLPEDWKDKWNGQFQLLNSYYYNLSDYYIRTNVTYQSPLLCLCRIPRIGKYIELERIYVNALMAERLYPYVELGYGLKCGMFSAALFTSNINGKFKRMGFSVTFNLFDNWQ